MGCHGCRGQRISGYVGVSKINYSFLDANLSEVEEEVNNRPFVVDDGKLVAVGLNKLDTLISEFHKTRPNALITTIELYKEILKVVNSE